MVINSLKFFVSFLVNILTYFIKTIFSILVFFSIGLSFAFLIFQLMILVGHFKFPFIIEILYNLLGLKVLFGLETLFF